MDDHKEEKHVPAPVDDAPMPFGPAIEIVIADLPEPVQGIAMQYDANQDGELSKQELKADDAHQSIFDALTALGLSPEALATALGIEPAEQRKKYREEQRAERERQHKEEKERYERLRADWEKGQKFDKDERERLKREALAPTPTPAPAPAPAPAPVDNSGDVKVEIVTFEPNRLVINYTNTTKAAASLKIRVGSTDRPDRLVAAGKVATSTYTTTSKGGFKGQRVLVGWIEKNATVFDKVL